MTRKALFALVGFGAVAVSFTTYLFELIFSYLRKYNTPLTGNSPRVYS